MAQIFVDFSALLNFNGHWPGPRPRGQKVGSQEVPILHAFFQLFPPNQIIRSLLTFSVLTSFRLFTHNFNFSRRVRFIEFLPQFQIFPSNLRLLILGVLTSFSLNFKFSRKIKFVYFWRFDEFFQRIRKYIPSKFMSAEYSSHPNFCLF